MSRHRQQITLKTRIRVVKRYQADLGVNDTKLLKFPLSIGQTWMHCYERGSGRRTTWVEPQYKVTTWGKYKRPRAPSTLLRSSVRPSGQPAETSRGLTIGRSTTHRKPNHRFFRIGDRRNQKKSHASRLQCVALNRGTMLFTREQSHKRIDNPGGHLMTVLRTSSQFLVRLGCHVLAGFDGGSSNKKNEL